MSESDTIFNKRDWRCAAVQLILSTNPSYDNRTIASTLKMQIWTVQCLRTQLNTSDDTLEVVEQKPKAEDNARKTQTKEFIEKFQAIIDETPQQPIRQIARDLGISHTTVNACVKEDLKCRSYRCQTSQILTEKTKNLRLIKSVKLLNKLKHLKKPNMLWFFSDKKNFCQDQVHNRTIAGLPWITGACPWWWKQSFPLRLWSLVWFQVRAISCHLTSLKSAWKSAPKCTWMCWRVWWSPVAIRWPVADPGCGSRTQCQPTSPKLTQAWLQKECYDFVPFSHRLPSSSNQNPLDYFVRSYVENITNMTAHNTKASLITTIRWAPASTCGKGMLPVPIHIEAVIEAEGSYIK